MDIDKRGSRRIKNRVVVYYRVLKDSEIDNIKDEIYHTVDPDESFSFFMSLKRLDSSFGDLNKAFVLMMKQMDAKLNYIIDLLRNNGKISELDDFKKAITCDLSQTGLSIETDDAIDSGRYLYLKMFLPIATHHAIKILSRVVRAEKRNDTWCLGLDIQDIATENRELIIHYMIYVERKMAKDRVEKSVS